MAAETVVRHDETRPPGLVENHPDIQVHFLIGHQKFVVVRPKQLES